MARPPSGFATLRDLVSFALGGGILYYAVIAREPPADLIAVGAGITLCGFPIAALIANPGGSRPNDRPPS